VVGDLVRLQDRAGQLQTTAAGASGDVDGEDAGQELGPRDASGSARVGVERRRCDVGSALDVEQRELKRNGGGLGSRARDDVRAKVVSIGEDAVVPDHVKPRRRDETGELGQERLR